MIFNSFEFLLFFVAFFVLYWFVTNKNLKIQNLLILLAGYIFYSWSDWRFLTYLIGISALNFYLGIYIEKTSKPTIKRLLLYVGLVQGIGGLAFFKYFNFFIDSFKDAFHLMGVSLNLHTLNLIVPLGISFFTFRTISYLLDINKGKISPCRNWVVFFCYVSFFPSLLSGPIDRAKNLVPQLERKREFNYFQATSGLRQILWGLFKKIAIADNCASVTNQVFDNYLSYSASSLLVSACIFTIQIYADFSGYSDMAIGIARLMGFKIAKNFDFPLFAQNIAEFWRKWHMSLTSWMTDYVFTPLSIALRDLGKLGLVLAIVLNFTLIGIWHGANWTYLLFGFLHGIYFIPLILRGTMSRKYKIVEHKVLPSLSASINMLGTFMLVTLTFIIFKSENISAAFNYYSRLFSLSLFTIPDVQDAHFLLLAAFLIVEWLGKSGEYAMEKFTAGWNKPFRWAFYLTVVFMIFMYQGKPVPFIYFKF